jgi:hypothetical protein
MKIYLFLFTVATVLPPTLAMMLTRLMGVIAHISWSMPNDDVTHITFPINIANAPHKSVYRFSHTFILGGQRAADIIIGLLPQPDAGPGISVIRAIFESTLSLGPTINVDDNCTPDDGGGAVCTVNFNGTYDNMYNLGVRHTGGTTWNGMVINTVTNRRIHIGSITLPVGVGTNSILQCSFVEFADSEEEIPCNKFPHSSVVFGVPTTDAGVGELEDPTERGCAGEDNFEFQRTADDGIEILLGSPAEAAIIRVQQEAHYALGEL